MGAWGNMLNEKASEGKMTTGTTVMETATHNTGHDVTTDHLRVALE